MTEQYRPTEDGNPNLGGPAGVPNDGFEERLEAFDRFVSCPECGSGDATVDITWSVDADTEQYEWVDVYATCSECDHSSPRVFHGYDPLEGDDD